MKTLKKLKREQRIAIKNLVGPTKIDLGCGPNRKEGFHGVDAIAFPGVDTVMNLVEETLAPTLNRKVTGYKSWPWKDNSIEEAHSSHFIEHLTPQERVHVFNELWRVLKVGAKATIITPHWASCRAYGDPTHQWPPVSEFSLFYLNKKWRDANAPHTDRANLSWGYNCNFDITWGFSLEPGVAMRDQNYQQHALTYWKEAAQDQIATITKCA